MRRRRRSGSDRELDGSGLGLVDDHPSRRPVDPGFDLVPDDARNLGHVGGPLQNPAIDVDKTSGERERIDHVRIHDLELPLQICP